MALIITDTPFEDCSHKLHNHDFQIGGNKPAGMFYRLYMILYILVQHDHVIASSPPSVIKVCTSLKNNVFGPSFY